MKKDMILTDAIGSIAGLIINIAVSVVMLAIGYYIYYRVEKRAIKDALTEYQQGDKGDHGDEYEGEYNTKSSRKDEDDEEDYD